VVEHVAEIGAHFGVDIGQIEAGQLRADLFHGDQHSLQQKQVPPQVEEFAHLGAGKCGIERTLFEPLDDLARRIDDRKVVVGNHIEQSMEDIVHSVRQQRRPCLEFLS